MPDVVIVGGGVMGCAAAYVLARDGYSVRVIEQDRVGAHASGGAAGILTVNDPDPGSPYDALTRASLALFPAYAAALYEETGIDIEYRNDGVLFLLAPDERPTRILPDAVLLDRPQLLDLEPNVGPGWPAAVFYPRDGHVNSGRLTRALAEAAARRGAEIREGVRVTGFQRDGNAITVVRTTEGDVSTGSVVIAAGPWSGLLREALGFAVPVTPVKGQIVWGQMRPLPVRRPVFAGCYIVPKAEAGIALGATHEESVFDETPTLGAAAELIALGVGGVPALADAAFSRIWSSIRPGTPDDMPILGPAPSLQNCFLATGHYAYGITLSLITGELVGAWVSGEDEPVDTSSFRIERFEPTP